MEKLNRAQKWSILGPQNLGSRGAPLDPRLAIDCGGPRVNKFELVYDVEKLHPFITPYLI